MSNEKKVTPFHLALAWRQKCSICTHNNAQILTYLGMVFLTVIRKADLSCQTAVDVYIASTHFNSDCIIAISLLWWMMACWALQRGRQHGRHRSMRLHGAVYSPAVAIVLNRFHKLIPVYFQKMKVVSRETEKFLNMQETLTAEQK